MNEFSLSSQTEPSLPQIHVPRRVDPGLETQQVTSPQASPGDGAGTMLKPAPAAKSTRLFFVDHLRAFLIILVIMGHLAITYGAIGSFYYHDTINTLTSYVLTILVMIGQAYGLHFVTLYPLLKYGLAVIIAVPCCFTLGALVRMLPYARRIF